MNGALSNQFNCGVIQGCCVGPILFSIYASRLFEIIEGHLPQVHDGTQLYLFFSPNKSSNMQSAIEAMTNCSIEDIRHWMISNKLMINDDKTEFMIIRARQKLTKVKIDHISAGN